MSSNTKRISQLTQAGGIQDNDLIPIVQNAETKKIEFSTFKQPLEVIEQNVTNIEQNVTQMFNVLTSFFNIIEFNSDNVTLDDTLKENVIVNTQFPLVNLTIDTNHSFSLGEVVSLENWIQNGIINIIPDAGVTINHDTQPILLAEQGYLRYIGNDNWLLFGNI